MPKRKIIVTDYDGKEVGFHEWRLLDAATYVWNSMEECCSLEGEEKEINIKIRIVDEEED